MTAPPPTLLGVEELAFGHGTRCLGRSLSFELAAGESLALLGPNGAGKTTLVRTLAGQIPPLAGRVLLGGRPTGELPSEERARRVALLPQDGPLDLGLTVRELVELGRVPHLGLFGRAHARDRAAVEQALAACALEGLASRPLGHLSGGERQRARLALALAQESPLLLLDEPLTHLDLRREHELFLLLGRLRAERGLALVLVLHDLRAAVREVDRALVLAEGEGSWLPAEPAPRRALLSQAFGVPEERLPL